MDNKEEFDKLNLLAEEYYLKKENEKRAENRRKAIKVFQEHSLLVDKLILNSTDFYKHIATILTGFLGLLIGLAPVDKIDQLGKKLFLGCVLSISLCIVLSVLVVYGNISFLKKWSDNVLDRGLNLLNNIPPKKIDFLQPDKIYKYIEIATLINLVVCLILILSYAINMVKI